MSPSVRQNVKDVPSVAVAQHARPRILAIDYGRRKIGLALSDPLAMIAQPLATLERTNRRADLQRLRRICRQHQVGRILVGHPLRLGGDAGEMAGEAARFATRLKRELGIEVELVDERLTSWEAGQTLIETKSSHRKRQASARRRPLDDVAAAVLLRDYLSRDQGRGANSAASSTAVSAERA
jgi:putative holliday junction resolvase